MAIFQCDHIRKRTIQTGRLFFSSSLSSIVHGNYATVENKVQTRKSITYKFRCVCLSHFPCIS